MHAEVTGTIWRYRHRRLMRINLSHETSTCTGQGRLVEWSQKPLDGSHGVEIENTWDVKTAEDIGTIAKFRTKC